MMTPQEMRQLFQALGHMERYDINGEPNVSLKAVFNIVSAYSEEPVKMLYNADGSIRMTFVNAEAAEQRSDDMALMQKQISSVDEMLAEVKRLIDEHMAATNSTFICQTGMTKEQLDDHYRKIIPNYGEKEDHQDEKHPTALEVDLEGWNTAERLIDTDQVKAWKEQGIKAVKPPPPDPYVEFDGDPEQYSWVDRDLTWWQRTKRKLSRLL